jgi:hypothetical protein
MRDVQTQVVINLDGPASERFLDKLLRIQKRELRLADKRVESVTSTMQQILPAFVEALSGALDHFAPAPAPAAAPAEAEATPGESDESATAVAAPDPEPLPEEG